MLRATILLILAACLVAGGVLVATAAKVTNAYGTATVTTEAQGVQLAVAIAPAYQVPNADPFDVEVICIDASGMYKWLLTLDSKGHSSLNLVGSWRSASYYDIDTEASSGVSFSFFLPAPLVNPDDRMLVSIADDSITASGPIFSIPVPAYQGQPLRMGTLRVTLALDESGAIVITAQNLTHVPLFVPLVSLILGLAPTPDWIPDTTPDIRWTPEPALSQQILIVGADESTTIVLPLPAIPAAFAAAYRNALATTYLGFVDLFPGDYLAMGFPVAWGVSWSYLPIALP